MTNALELIQSPAEWREVESAVRGASRLAFDLEADGFHRYPERTALLQLALPNGRVLVVDPLAVPELDAFGAALADPENELALHSGSYDVRALDRDFGFRVSRLFDTAIAAQFCGLEKLGLGNVLEERLGISLPKPKRLQRFDWSRRPLPADALAYAADDVRHLLDLADDLLDELGRLGRESWVREECGRLAEVRWEAPPLPSQACLRVKGARELNDRERAILCALYTFRDEEARAAGRPPHFILGNKDMLHLARSQRPSSNDLAGRARGLRGAVRERLAEAIDRGRRGQPVPWPRSTYRNDWTPEARDRLNSLKDWRQREAAALALDPGIVWPAAHLERLALRPHQSLRELDDDQEPMVRRWQWNNLGQALYDFIGLPADS